MLRTDALETPLTGLEDFITEAGAFLGGSSSLLAKEVAEVQIVGPFPAVTATARAFVAEGARALTASGWRALARIHDQPSMVLDILIGDDGAPHYGVRGDEAAAALEAALAAALPLQDAPEVYDVQWLSVPDIYVTGVWLAAEEPRFIPTRLGDRSRIDRQIMGEDELKAIIEQLLARADSAPTAVASLGGDFAAKALAQPDDDMADARSGPAD